MKDYQTWAEKAIKAKDAISDLHDKVRDYIKDLKDVRDEQRKSRIDRLETYQKIGTSSYTSDAGGYWKLRNGQLAYDNSVLRSTNRAYDSEVRYVESDNKRIRNTANRSIRGLISQNSSRMISRKTSKGTRNKLKKYNSALEKAQGYIKNRKKIPSSILNTVLKNSIDTYERLYAYNLSLDNLEAAKLERAVAYAENSAKIYENIQEQYEKRDDATKNTMDLRESMAKNTTDFKAANKLLNKVAGGYDTIIKNDRSEIRKYSKSVSSTSKTILRKSGITRKFSDLSSKKQKDVRKTIEAAKKKVRKGVTISTNILSRLAKYNTQGYVTDAFYNACINYNNALEHKRQAEAQLEIDKQTRIQEKEALGAEKVSNVQQSYTNAQNKISGKNDLTEAKQNTKTTIGKMLSESDYSKSLDYNAQMMASYSAEIKDINKTIENNLKTKLWKKTSQEYLNAKKEVQDLEVELQNCITTQEELNNKIIQIPYDKIADALDKLDTIAEYHKSISDLKTAKSEDLSLEDYLQQISDNDAKIAEYQKQRAQLEIDLQAAKDNGGYYGGKSITDWRQELRESVKEINDLEADNEKLKDSLRDDVYWREFERAHKAAERLSDILSGMTDLLDDDMFFDKDGGITEWGIDQIAALTKQFENARDEVQNYSADIDNLNKLYEQGEYTQLEYIEKLGELQGKLLSSASDMKKYLDSIKEMYKDMAKEELDALFKLIDARADALDKKKACESKCAFYVNCWDTLRGLRTTT